MVQRIVVIDDEELDENGNMSIVEDITEVVDALSVENEQLLSTLQEVEASFDEQVQQGVELSLARQGNAKTAGANSGVNHTTSKIKPKASPAINSAKVAGVGKAAGRTAKGAKNPRLGAHLLAAAKKVGQFAAKHKAGLAAGALAGAATGAIAGKVSHQLSQEELSLDEGEGFDPESDYTEEELASMTHEDAIALLEEAEESGELTQDDVDAINEAFDAGEEEEKRQQMNQFVQSVMVKDAESRSAK